jgi:hypothetical protein
MGGLAGNPHWHRETVVFALVSGVTPIKHTRRRVSPCRICSCGDDGLSQLSVKGADAAAGLQPLSAGQPASLREP